MVQRKAAKGQFTFLPADYENYSPFGLLNGIGGLGHLLLKAQGLAAGSLFFEKSCNKMASCVYSIIEPDTNTQTTGRYPI